MNAEQISVRATEADGDDGTPVGRDKRTARSRQLIGQACVHDG